MTRCFAHFDLALLPLAVLPFALAAGMFWSNWKYRRQSRDMIAAMREERRARLSAP
jgi:hypothetical protein